MIFIERTRGRWIPLAIAIGFCGGGIRPAAGLDVEPEVLVFHLKPGKRARGELRLFNDDVVHAPVQISVRSESSSGEQPWLSIAKPTFTLAPGERRRVRVKVNAPRGEGERRAELVATVPGKANSELRVRRVVRLSLAGTERYGLTLEDSRVDVKDGRVSVWVDCRNTGNMTLGLKMAVDWAGGPPRTMRQGGDAVFLPPGGATRLMVEGPTPDGPWDGRGVVTVYYRNARGEPETVKMDIARADKGAP